MTHHTVKIDCRPILDWDTFHDTFARALGFPGFYGRNMDAWIDCMTYLDEDDGMRSVTVEPGEFLVLHLEHAKALAERCPEIWVALHECAAFVNGRRLEMGQSAVLAIAMLG